MSTRSIGVRVALVPMVVGSALGLSSVRCGGTPSEIAAPIASRTAARSHPDEPSAPPAPAASAPPAAAQQDAPAPAPPPECPPGMRYVRHDFCPKLQRRCIKSEYDKSNHITICHRFEAGAQTCQAPRIALHFCIDEYEYPNRKGAHPPVMVDWYTAKGTCAAEGKRLCYEREWVAACEGPEETPFPYGWERSREKCNIDNRWISPNLKKIYSPDPAVSEPELKRLDQSVPSGSMRDCVSGYGVRDLTGNFDEWALADRARRGERAGCAALKGGAWGHVRNACRPVTTSHEPTFRYYFVSFRCCRDPASVDPPGRANGDRARTP